MHPARPAPPREPPAERHRQSGTVTRVAQQKRDADRVSIYLDGAFAFGLTVDVAMKAGLRKGRHLSVEEQDALVAEDERVRARIAALDYLSYKARTEMEVERKLREKGFGEIAIAEAVTRLGELGYLDDEAYARAYARARLSGRGHGPTRIRADLRKRGVANGLIDRVLEDVVEPDELLEQARRHAQKRWPRLQREEDPYKRRKKLGDYLRRRGFSFDLIRRVIEELDAEE